jgi:hypothetical protein
MGSQGILDLQRPDPITSHDDHLIDASREWARVLGVLVRMIAEQILAPIERFYQGQEENFSPQGLRGNPAAPCSHGRPGTPGMIYLVQDSTFVSNAQTEVSRSTSSPELVQRRWKRVSKADIVKMMQTRKTARLP